MPEYATGSREAVEIILRHLRGEWAHDSLNLVVDFDGEDPTEQDRRGFGEFVAALEQNRNVTHLSFENAQFDRAHETFERLFGQVLPTQMNSFKFLNCRIITEYIAMFATSQTERGQGVLEYINFRNTRLDHQGVVALANNLLRGNDHILEFALNSCGIDSAGCQAILESLDGNAHLRVLDLSINDISEISSTAAQALARSGLWRRLCLSHNPLTDESVRILAEGLRTNFSLEKLYLWLNESQVLFDLVKELLTTFNFTLGILRIAHDDTHPFQQGIDQMLRRNVPVRFADLYLQLLEYHVPELSVWPDVLARISSKPSLLYRFVRHGNLVSFKNLVSFVNELSS